MKLSKKGMARQRAIRKALAAGKALGGLLSGIVASVVSGCSEHSPANTMGSYPAPNSIRESRNRAAVRGKMILSPERERTNSVNEAKGKFAVDGMPASESTNAVHTTKKPDVADGDR